MLENWETKKVAKWFLGEWEILNSSLQCMEKIKPGLYQLIIHNFAKSAWILEIFGPRYIRMTY